jgi:hypothetical protein
VAFPFVFHADRSGQRSTVDRRALFAARRANYVAHRLFLIDAGR